MDQKNRRKRDLTTSYLAEPRIYRESNLLTAPVFSLLPGTVASSPTLASAVVADGIHIMGGACAHHTSGTKFIAGLVAIDGGQVAVRIRATLLVQRYGT